MNSFTSRSVLFSLVSSVALVLVSQVGAQQTDGTALATQETARRQQAMRDAMQKVQEARTAYTEGRYGVAVDCYRAALKVVPKAPASEKQVKFINDSLADALVAKAMDYRKVGRTDEAVAFLKEAMEVSPGHKFAANELAKTQDPAYTNPALTPRHVGNVEEVSRLLNLAYGYYDLGNFDKAEETFNAVLQIDAYNTAAQRGKEMVQNRRMNYYKSARDSFRAKALTDVDKQWEESTPENVSVGKVTTGEAGAVIHQDIETENSIAAALKEMVLPQIVFEDATIKDVVETLQGQIARFTAQGVTASRNINVVTDFGPADSPAYKAIMEKRVTLDLSNVSVASLLDVLDRQLGIKHYITPLGVELSFSGRDFGPMVERVYTLPPHFFDVKGEGSDDEEDEEDDDFSSSSGIRVTRLNPVQALKSMGISFPEGARARYDSANRVLTVRNTAFNHEEIEELISVPAETQKAVVLNIIAMEIDETDLNELGFEWMFNFNIGPKALFATGGETANYADFAAMPTGYIDVNFPKTGFSATEGLRSGSSVITADNVDELVRTGRSGSYSAAMGARGKAPGIFSFRGVWGAGDVSMLMRGAAQKKGTDILTNPRLLLTPGREEQVVFANVDELYIPEAYAEPDIYGEMSSDGGDIEDNDWQRQGNVALAQPAHPSEFSRFAVTEDGVGGVGSVVQVHSAEIEADGQFVTLALTVTLNELEGFVNWGEPIVYVTSHEGTIQTITLTDNKVLQPIFKRNMENTKITVGSGSVLVIGGLKEAKTVKYEDKLPVLGDLPMVGRLFRSSGEEQVRKAFLMFVKVDIVDPTGQKVNEGPSTESPLD